MSELEDVSKVEKYEISEEEFAKREGTFRKFKESMLKKDPDFLNKSGQKIPADFQKEEADQMKLGDRCEATIGGARGEIRFIGKIPELSPGFWVGVQLDEPSGDTDGTLKSKSYFEAKGGAKYGTFYRPKDLRIGEYPPLNDFDADNDEI